jgi:16S rRNA (guanine527-N7)-methyltransferase
MDELANALVERASVLGLSVATDVARKMIRHAELVYEANRALNLTRIPWADAIPLHILDSLCGMSSMREAPEGVWADLGSGAGYPGIPLCLMAQRHVDLLESSGKKADFLESVVADVRLDITVRRCRAEEAAIETPAAYSAIAVRAVSSLPARVELASPLLSPGGLLICWKGDPEEEELRRGAVVARQVGMGPASCRPVTVPGVQARRTIVVYEKTGEPKVRMPRRPGMAQRSPLA